MAPAVGLSLSTYRRLDNGQIENPPIRYLINCAMVLDVPLTSLIEDHWLEWAQLGDRTPIEPPDLYFQYQHRAPALPPE